MCAFRTILTVEVKPNPKCLCDSFFGQKIAYLCIFAFSREGQMPHFPMPVGALQDDVGTVFLGDWIITFSATLMDHNSWHSH